jgi:hypothetical protein
VRTITWCTANAFIVNGVCDEFGTPQNFESGYLVGSCMGGGWRVYTLQGYPVRGTNTLRHYKYLDSNEIAKGSSTNCANKTSIFSTDGMENLGDCFYAFPTGDITLTRSDFVVTYDETDAGTTYKCDVNPDDDPIFPEWIKLSANPLP